MPTAMQYQILIIHITLMDRWTLEINIYMDIYNSQLRYGFRYLVYLVSPLLLERLTSISILLYQFEGQAYVDIHKRKRKWNELCWNKYLLLSISSDGWQIHCSPTYIIDFLDLELCSVPYTLNV
jgi:hypothetical protein